METVKLSSKFQIVIPRDVREKLKLKPGAMFRVFEVGGMLRLVPVRPIKEYRGILKGLLSDTEIEREEDRL